MNAPKLRSIASAICALALGMTLVACGGPSSYSQELLTEASGIKVTCENSKGDTALSEGAIVVEENGIVVISPDLTKGSIHVKITSEDGKTTVYDDDADGRILEVNQAFLDMFDLADEEAAKPKSFSDFMNDDPLPENFRKALAGERTVTGIVAEGDDGSEEEVEVVLAPNLVARKVIGVVGSLLKA